MFDRIDTVILRVRDVDAAERWYVDALGFSTDFRDPEERLVVLRVGSHHVITLWELKPGERMPDPDDAGTYPILGVSDAPRARELLGERGAVIGELADGPGIRFFSFRDPDGNRWEACETTSG